jgi:hypothetical protein
MYMEHNTRVWKTATNANRYDTLAYLRAFCLHHQLDSRLIKEVFDEVEHPYTYNLETNTIEEPTESRKRKRD